MICGVYKLWIIARLTSVHLGTHDRVIAHQPAGWCGNLLQDSSIIREEIATSGHILWPSSQ